MPTELPTTEHELLPWLIGVLVLAGLGAAAFLGPRLWRLLEGALRDARRAHVEVTTQEHRNAAILVRVRKLEGEEARRLQAELEAAQVRLVRLRDTPLEPKERD